MGVALPWRATCSGSTNGFLAGRWKCVFIRGFERSGSFPAPRNCGRRLRGILWQRGNILRGKERQIRISHRGRRGQRTSTTYFRTGAWISQLKLEIRNVPMELVRGRKLFAALFAVAAYFGA